MSEQHPTRAPKQLSDTPAQTHTQFTDIKPLTSTMPARRTQAGRPKKLVMPDLPEMKMTDIEQNLFEFFMAAYEQEYPDLTPTDHLILHLAGLKYIQYLRTIAGELETGKLITMARQHPGVELRGLLDQLSVTRKARTAKSRPTTSEEETELKEFFMGMSQGKSKQA